MQVVRCLLRMRGGGKDRPLVFLQHLQPALNVGGMIGARLRRQPEIGAKKRRAQFGNQLFPRIAFIAPALAPEFAARGAWDASSSACYADIGIRCMMPCTGLCRAGGFDALLTLPSPITGSA